ncbi:mismatch repair endonuclease PMS2 [Conger conger]|uniref:mismatch repair endonuclease PMS2 n=1 Tax=Conger conger TaxID=82655 RepID=UPI002A59E300|nr:mismatch repair endonuclease PMS2 [Conger conger]
MNDACSEPARAIKPIDRHSVHQICSGQVVLTLATAVKELVENSIDAGATIVEIRLKEYGAEQVEVSDNGKGVDEANFEGLTLKHYTSKLSSFSDLIHVETFGFRGEALSSLCALSDLSVVTCHESAQVGTRLVFDHNGKLTQRCPHPRQQGTTVTLQQLFSTLPVRHKEFQRNIKKEYSKMVHVLQSYCIISTGVRITCTNQVGQGKRSVVLCTSGSQSMKDNIGAVFGPKQLQSLVAFRQLPPTEAVKEDYGLGGEGMPEEFFTIAGFVSQGDHGVGRSATDRQFFYINTRPCDPSKVSKLVNEVYHMFNRHQYPFVALNITVASDCVDVNVTPDKRQIFLQEEKLLLATMKSSLIAMYESGVNKISLSSTALLMPLHRTVNTSTSVANHESVLDSEAALEVEDMVEPALPHTKSSLNLTGLRAAFSLHQTAGVDTKENVSKVCHQGPAQKKLQSFFKSTETSRPALPSLFRHSRDGLKCSPVMGLKSQENRGEGKTGSDIDSGRGSTVSERDSVTDTPESARGTVSEFSSPDTEGVEAGVKSESTEGWWGEDHKPAVWNDSEASRSEGRSSSPGTKRARLDEDLSAVCTAQPRSDAQAPPSGLKVDAPVRMHKRTVPLQFSLPELAAGLQRLREQEAQRAEGLKYRRFRAKISPGENQSAEDELKKEISKDMFREMEIIGQFNLGFIITKLKSDIFMIDQHATDEKYNFEMLQQHTILQGQRLIAPQKLHLPAVSETVLIENLEIFQKNGFDFIIDEEAPVMERAKLVSLPTSKNWTFGPGDIEEMIFMLSDSPGVMCRPSRVRQMFASRACRKSVMIGTALNSSEMKKLVVHMGEIEQPWNCPHGRPTMRHLANLNMLSQD